MFFNLYIPHKACSSALVLQQLALQGRKHNFILKYYDKCPDGIVQCLTPQFVLMRLLWCRLHAEQCGGGGVGGGYTALEIKYRQLEEVHKNKEQTRRAFLTTPLNTHLKTTSKLLAELNTTDVRESHSQSVAEMFPPEPMNVAPGSEGAPETD